MNMEIRRIKSLMLSVMLVSCVGQELTPESSVSEEQLPMRISGSITQAHTTRVSDIGFADGDEIGVYVVNYVNGEAGTISSTENQATNVRHTYDVAKQAWVPDYPIYWKDRTTLVDAYGYYPYVDDITDVLAIPFIVRQNQSDIVEELGISGYEASDFLWAKSSAVSPSSQTIYLNHRHIMAGVQVTLVQGDGFTAEGWAGAEKIVMVENTIQACHIDLSDGTVIVDENTEPEAITPVDNSGDWRAVVVPQTVDQGKTLISITVNGYSYYHALDEMMTYHPGKLHKFTIEVHNSMPDGDYRFVVIDESITAWESDNFSHAGDVCEYFVVDVPEAGQLRNIIEGTAEAKNVFNLKITGQLTGSDFDYIRTQMTNLEAINLYECQLIDCFCDYDFAGDGVLPGSAFKGLKYLKSCVFPKNIKAIGMNAFSGTQLSGSLIIPEGVIRIGNGAFSKGGYEDYAPNLTGALSLPSTLEYIGDGAFSGCMFTSEISLPENLTYIGAEAFFGCSRMTGKLVLPESLETIGPRAFMGASGLTGVLKIPNGVKKIQGQVFTGLGISGLILPDGLEEIQDAAFSGTRIYGDLILPESVYYIGNAAFENTDIISVKLPENLDIIKDDVFNNCRCLCDTLVLPDKIESIGSRAFRGCDKLTAVALPSKLGRIKERAFEGCFSLVYISSTAIEPPVIENLNAFDGVAKDNFTVEVPEDAVAAYRSANYWNEFKRISAYKGFVCRPSFANVLNAGGTRDFVLNAPAYTGWSVVYCPEWCHLSTDSGTGKTELTLTIDNMQPGSGNRHDTIIMKLDDEEEYLTYIDVGQYDYEYNEDEQLILQSATRGNGIDIFIVGDGYDAADISTGVYLNDMRQEIEYFFGVEPYKTYREYFDVHTAIALSSESGIGTLNTLRDVKFDTRYGDFGNERINGDAEAVVEYAIQTVDDITSENIHRLTAIVIPNSDAYDGVTNMWTNGTAVSFCPKSSAEYPNDARGLIQHEAGGHAFGKLGDEYIYHLAFIQTCNCICCDHVDGILDAQSHGWYRNLSLSGKYKDVEWAHLIYDPDYTDIVDIYEGGYFHSRGVYRSEYNSCMNDNVPYFSTISRQAIVERIKEYAGEEFSYDEFVANDSKEWGVDFTDQAQTRGMMESHSSVNVHRHQPIIIEGSPLD